MIKSEMIDWLNEHVTEWDEDRTVKTDESLPDGWLSDFPVGVKYFRIVNLDSREVIYRSDVYVKESEDE